MIEPPGRTLALDLGDARVGLAISDPLGLTAQPAGRLDCRGRDRRLRRLREIIAEHGVVRVVVGRPLHLSGAVGRSAEAASAFAAALAEAHPAIAVEMWDERLTTVEVERAMISDNVSRRRRREVVDSLSAVLILQSYLDARAFRDAGRGP